MTITAYPRTCAYAGLIDVYLRTFTTTYAPFNDETWQFNAHSLNPMEAHGFVASAAPVGFYVRMLDLGSSTGYTTAEVGDNTISNQQDGVFYSNTGPVWQNNQIGGWCYGSTLTLRPYTFFNGLTIGNDLTTSVFNPANVVKLPNATNTGAPDGPSATNFPALDNSVYGSAVINLNQQYYTAQGNAIKLGDAGLDLGFGALAHEPACAMTYNNDVFCFLNNPTTPGDPTQLLQTDWLTYGDQFTLTYQDPPNSTITMQTLMTDGRAPHATYAGFSKVYTGQVTIDGQACNGFVILTAPDLLSYRIIRLIGLDATAAAWYTDFGTYEAKLDTTGALWMKNVNSKTTLFVSGGSVLKVLPIFLPVPIPGGSDYDDFLRIMRSKGPHA
jgi:hypothetical protein